MSKYSEVAAKIAAEQSLRPAQRTQPVPCAFCVRGGNGEQSCASGMFKRRYSKYEGCFAGALLDGDPALKGKEVNQ